MLKPFSKLLAVILIVLSNSTFAQSQNDSLSPSDRATMLTRNIRALYYQQNWPKIVENAQQAILLDSNAYNKNAPWEQIGEARFKLSDYKGAINDFNRFIAKEIKNDKHNINITNWVKINKANAEYALGQLEEAAKTHLFFLKNNMCPGLSSIQQAAILYKQLHNEIRYHQLIDSAVITYQLVVDQNIKRNILMQPTFMLDYAEVLLMAEKPATAIEILNKPTVNSYSKREMLVKNYLSSVAQYLANPLLFEQIKTSLTNDIMVNGKITDWYFGMFNSWIALSDFSEMKKQQLITLQQMVQ